MITYRRICLKDLEFTDTVRPDRVALLKRGKEYITSKDYGKGEIIVFTSPYWIYDVPVSLFAGEERFT